MAPWPLKSASGVNESAAARRVFFTGGGGAPTSCDRRRASKTAAIGGVSEQKIQDFQSSLK